MDLKTLDSKLEELDKKLTGEIIYLALPNFDDIKKPTFVKQTIRNNKSTDKELTKGEYEEATKNCTETHTIKKIKLPKPVI